MTNQKKSEKLEDLIKKSLKTALEKAFPEVDYSEIHLERPRERKNGDLSSNIGLKLCKLVKKTPQEVVESLIKNLAKIKHIEKVEFAAPGFINFFFTLDYSINQLEELIKQHGRPSDPENKKRKIVIEYSQPNIAKPLGVHHLLSTIIGQVLVNIYRELDFEVLALNYLGDYGTQFGKLIYAYKKWGSREKVNKNPIPELLALYVKFHEESEKNPELDEEGRKEFKKLEDKDQENRQLWEWIKDISLKEINKTYDLLGGINFDLLDGEAFYEDKMEEIVQEGLKKKIFVYGEKNAIVVKFPNEEFPPCVVKKSDGASLYFTRDLAVIKHRTKFYHPEKITYVIDSAQSLYLKQLFATVKMLWGEENLPELIHIEFGRMSFPDMAMSTRKGNIILLDNVLKEGIIRAKKIVLEKNPALNEEEAEVISRKVGIGAIKYAVLSQNRNTNIVFTWDKILSLEGNSAPYLQYAYARANGILINAKMENIDFNTKSEKTFKEERERNLLSLLNQYSSILRESAREYQPNILCNYLYKLTREFHAFYAEIPVLKASSNEEKLTRLFLVNAVSLILKNGLNLLGIEVMEKM